MTPLVVYLIAIFLFVIGILGYTTMSPLIFCLVAILGFVSGILGVPYQIVYLMGIFLGTVDAFVTVAIGIKFSPLQKTIHWMLLGFVILFFIVLKIANASN